MSVVTDQEASERYRQRLEEYCSKHVLGPNSGFCCEHGEACRSSVGGKRNSFAAGQLSYVGDGYAVEIDGRPMRILIVPIQVGRDQVIDMGTRREQIRACIDPSRQNQHMRAVVEVLQVLFGLEPGGIVKQIDSNSHVLEAYAMANSVLCSNLSGSPTDAMLKNCREHLRQTIELLEPTIIVTQGNVPRDTLRKAVDRYEPTIYDRVARVTIKGVQAVCCEILLPSPGFFGSEGHFRQVAVPALERARRLALGKAPDGPPVAPPASSDEQSADAEDAGNNTPKIAPVLSTETGEIRAFMERPENVELMIDATSRGRPAVEPLEEGFLKEFDPQQVSQDNVKQRIGRVARAIMEANGYEHVRHDVPIHGRLFTLASLYRAKGGQPVAASPPAAEQSADAPDAGNGEAESGGAADPNLPYYIIHTYSGFEKKVQESLRTRADSFGYTEKVGKIRIPTESVVEMRNGKKVTTERLLYPGYVLVQLALDDDLWHVIKNTPRVTGFVGGGHDPQPLTDDEVNQILNREKDSAERPRPKMEFARNDRVKIADGPFSGFSGTVEEVNEDRSTVKVMVTIFGRGTPVELEYFQVEKEG